MWTGIEISEINSGAVNVSSGQEQTQLWLATDDAQEGTFLVDNSSDLETMFAGNSLLISELKTALLNGRGKWVVHLSLSSLSGEIEALMEEVWNSHKFRTVVFPTLDLTETEANEIKNALQSFEDQKRFVSAIARFRKEDTENGETPTEYVDDFLDEFAAFSADQLSILTPTSCDKHLGAYAGRKIGKGVQESAGRVASGGLLDVALDPDYSNVYLKSLAEARAVVLRRFDEDPTSIHVNDDTVMYPTIGDVTHITDADILNKAKRLLCLGAFPLINDHKYPNTEAGAVAAAIEAKIPVEQMVTDGEVQKVTVTATPITNGFRFLLQVTLPFHAKIIENEILLTSEGVDA